MRRSATKLPLTRADALGLLTARVSASFLALGTLALGQEPSAPDPFAASGAAHVAVSDQGTVELHVADMPLATVLQLLSLESKQNIVASPKVQGTVTANLYGVSFEEALQAILVANDAGYKRVGKFIYVYTTAELDAIAAEAKNKQITKVFHLNYVNAADAGNYVRPVLGEDAKVSVSPPPASGLGSEAGEGGGNMNAASDFMIVTARPSELREVERILKEIDVRPRQVLVEATILRATLTDDNSLGIDFTIVGGVDLELLGSTSTGIANLTLGQLPTERFEQFAAKSADRLTLQLRRRDCAYARFLQIVQNSPRRRRSPVTMDVDRRFIDSANDDPFRDLGSPMSEHGAADDHLIDGEFDLGSEVRFQNAGQKFPVATNADGRYSTAPVRRQQRGSRNNGLRSRCVCSIGHVVAVHSGVPSVASGGIAANVSPCNDRCGSNRASGNRSASRAAPPPVRRTKGSSRFDSCICRMFFSCPTSSRTAPTCPQNKPLQMASRV
ncbi:MAG: hypothetical protein IID35_12555, partial [Planctomycetes bacterium]|nr:hypothetical protein [Planctomycetota bacterium]